MGFMFWIWVAVCLASIVVEIVSPSLVSIWFIAGGGVALILSCFEPIAWYWQLLAFIFISVVCLIFARPLAKKLQARRETESNAESFEGKEVRLTSDVTFDKLGTAVLNGVTWNVRSRDDEELQAGDVVVVVALDGNKLVVEKK